MSTKSGDVDRGWAWVAMTAGFLFMVVHGAVLYGAGILHVALLDTFGRSDAYTSAVGSLYSSLLMFIGPVTSAVINISSCRLTMMIGGLLMFVGFSTCFFAQHLEMVLVFYGIIAGIGLSFSAIPPLVCMGYYFDRKRGFAIGIVVAGAGVGMFISGPLFQFLVDSYGLRGSFLILGAIAANKIVLASLMKPSETEKQHNCNDARKEDSGKNKRKINLRKAFHIDLFYDKTFLIILVQYFLWNMPVAMLLLHIPNFSIINGATPQDAAFLLVLIGLTGTFGRVLTGMALSPHGIDPVLLNMGLNGIICMVTVFFPFYSTNYAGQSLFACLFGFYCGALTCVITPLSVELLGLEKLSAAVGIMYCVGGGSHLLGPVLAGVLIDLGGKYETTFYISGALFFCASLLTWLSTLWRKDHTDRKRETEDLKNSTFLYQSGLLAGSIIIKADSVRSSQTSLSGTPNRRRKLANSEHCDSQHSLFRNVILRNLERMNRDSDVESQHSLFDESRSLTESHDQDKPIGNDHNEAICKHSSDTETVNTNQS